MLLAPKMGQGGHSLPPEGLGAIASLWTAEQILERRDGTAVLIRLWFPWTLSVAVLGGGGL